MTLEELFKLFINHKHTGALPDAKRFNPILEDGSTLSTANNIARTNVNNNFSTGQTVAGTVTATTFSGSGASLTNIPDTALSSNVALKNINNNFSADQSITGAVTSSDTSKIATGDGKGLSVGSTASPAFALNVFDDGNRFGLPDGTSGTKGLVRLSASGRYSTIGMDFGVQASGGTSGWVQARDIGTGYVNLLLNSLGGNVGIGNTSTSYKLDVYQSGTTSSGVPQWVVGVAGQGNSANPRLMLGVLGSSVDACYGALNVDHVWFTGNPPTTEKLRLLKDGTFKVVSLAGTGNRAVYSDSSGNLTNSSSDENLKKDISTISDNIDILSSLDKLRGVYFKWNTDIKEASTLGEQREIGVIAQEVESVLPEVVGTNSNGYKSVDYAKITAYLIEVVKAQQSKIKKLEDKVDSILNNNALICE